MNEHIKSVKIYFDEDLIRDNKIHEFLKGDKQWHHWVNYQYPYRKLTKEMFTKNIFYCSG